MPDTKTDRRYQALHQTMALAELTEYFDPGMETTLGVNNYGDGNITIQVHADDNDMNHGQWLASRIDAAEHNGISDPLKRTSRIVGDAVHYTWSADYHGHRLSIVTCIEWTNDGPQQSTTNGTMISRPVHGG